MPVPDAQESPYFRVFAMLCSQGIPGYTRLHIGVLGSRFPLDNLRRMLPLSRTVVAEEARSLAGSPNPGNPHG